MEGANVWCGGCRRTRSRRQEAAQTQTSLGGGPVCTTRVLLPASLTVCVRVPVATYAQVIPGSDGNEVSGLAWARGPADPHWRLFASTLSGQLLELSCQQAQAVAATDSGGGPIWSLQAAPCSTAPSTQGTQQQQQLVSMQLAAACGDGSVRLFSVASGVAGAVFERSLPHVAGNVLALAWHPNGTSLASGGSNGCIHLWDAATGARSCRCSSADRQEIDSGRDVHAWTRSFSIQLCLQTGRLFAWILLL